MSSSEVVNSGQSSNDAPARWWHIVLVVLMLLAATVGVGYAVWRLATGFADLNPTVAAAVVVTSGTVILSVASLLIQRTWERRRELEQQHREHKTPVYEEFFEFAFRLNSMTNADDGSVDPQRAAEAAQFFRGFTQKLLVWGSDDVLREYVVFQSAAAAAAATVGPDSRATLLSLERLMMAMRKDLGHKNKGIEPGDLLRTFVTDWDATALIEESAPSA